MQRIIKWLQRNWARLERYCDTQIKNQEKAEADAKAAADAEAAERARAAKEFSFMSSSSQSATTPSSFNSTTNSAVAMVPLATTALALSHMPNTTQTYHTTPVSTGTTMNNHDVTPNVNTHDIVTTQNINSNIDKKVQN